MVEAKANSSEFESPGTGSKGGSRVNILRSLDEAKAFLDVPIDAVWYETYYQFCNRLTALYFLNETILLRQNEPSTNWVHYLGTSYLTSPGTLSSYRVPVESQNTA